MSEKKEVPQWLIYSRKSMLEAKYKRAMEKGEQLKKEATEAITELINTYFSAYEIDDEEENKHNFDILNDAWKKHCQEVMATKSKYIKLDYHAFELTVKDNVESEKFQAYLTEQKAKLEELKNGENKVEEPVLTVVE